jgi:hypothetical protein
MVQASLGKKQGDSVSKNCQRKNGWRHGSLEAGSPEFKSQYQKKKKDKHGWGRSPLHTWALEHV